MTDDEQEGGVWWALNQVCDVMEEAATAKERERIINIMRQWMGDHPMFYDIVSDIEEEVL